MVSDHVFCHFGQRAGIQSLLLVKNTGSRIKCGMTRGQCEMTRGQCEMTILGQPDITWFECQILLRQFFQ